MDTLKNLFKKYRSMWRWALVGIITNMTDYCLFLFLYSLVASVLVANFFSGLVSLTINYLAHYFWSFKSTSDHMQSGKRYLLNLAAFWSFGTVILKLLILSGIDPYIAKIIPIFIIAPLSFISLNYFVFKKSLK
jgi:putative flippase GtrA